MLEIVLKIDYIKREGGGEAELDLRARMRLTGWFYGL